MTFAAMSSMKGATLNSKCRSPVRHRAPSANGGPHGAGGFIYPLVATFLLSGGREAEVLGLEIDDISFSRETITFQPNQWRRLKTRGSARVVPL
jgi:hypothetical protein